MDKQIFTRNFILRNAILFIVLWAIYIFSSEEKVSWSVVLDSFIGITTLFLIMFVHNLILLPNYFAKGKFLWYIALLIPFVLLSTLVVYLEGIVASMYLNDKGHINYGEAVSTVVFFLILATVMKSSLSWLDTNQRLVKEENERLKAELALLHLQINPHFFFNTLNNLYGLSIENSPKTPEVILKLSELMRYILYDSSASHVTIEKEVDYIKNYIELQQLRITNVDIVQTYDVQDNNLQISPHLLISLVENALKHGPDSGVSNPFIHIELKSDEDSLSFYIKNNFDTQAVPAKPTKRKGGIGLTNLKKHLEISYPKNHILTFNNENGIFEAKLILNNIQ